MKVAKRCNGAVKPQVNITANLMTTVTEECSEIIQAVSKSIRFGVNSSTPSLQREGVATNGEHIMKEFYQLAAVISMLQGCGVLPVLDDRRIKKIKADKRHKVKHYLDVSESMGCINQD